MAILRHKIKPIAVALLLFFVVFANTELSRSAEAAFADPYEKAPTINVLVLGDSFSAGNGAGQYYDNVNCYRSHRSWGGLFGNWLHGQNINARVENRACSGATTEDIIKLGDGKYKRINIDNQIAIIRDGSLSNDVIEKMLNGIIDFY